MHSIRFHAKNGRTRGLYVQKYDNPVCDKQTSPTADRGDYYTTYNTAEVIARNYTICKFGTNATVTIPSINSHHQHKYCTNVARSHLPCLTCYWRCTQYFLSLNTNLVQKCQLRIHFCDPRTIHKSWLTWHYIDTAWSHQTQAFTNLTDYNMSTHSIILCAILNQYLSMHLIEVLNPAKCACTTAHRWCLMYINSAHGHVPPIVLTSSHFNDFKCSGIK